MTFPALVPSMRTFTPGEYGHTPWRTMGGRQSQSRHSNAITNQRVRFTFLGLSQAQRDLIKAHWINRRGRALLFSLPSQVWSGTTDPTVFTPPGYAWRYASRPTILDVPCGLHDVTVELVMEPEVA
jgi:hypothetical protein